jgi:hypothetical protein
MDRQHNASGPARDPTVAPQNATLPKASGNLAAPLLDRLKGVIATGSGRWCALCPAHDDQSPSLSVSDRGDRVLIHCFSGCDASDILAALGLGWSDLYRDPWDCARLRPNEGAARSTRRTMAQADPMEIERAILRIAAADLRAGRVLSIEDEARVEVARLRVLAAHGRAQG